MVTRNQALTVSILKNLDLIFGLVETLLSPLHHLLHQGRPHLVEAGVRPGPKVVSLNRD